MRLILAKFIRIIDSIFDSSFNFLRILKLKLKYPGLKIDFKSKIGKNVKIVCVDGGEMNIVNTVFLDGSFIYCDINATIDIYNSFVGKNCVIAAKEKIIINDKCLFAEMVVIRDHNHKFGIGKDIVDAGFETAPIVIETNVWLGAKATILFGVTISEGSVVGASAVVTKSTNKNSINVGIPAREIN